MQAICFAMYLFFCFILAAPATDKKIGYWKGFLICFVASPIIGLLIIGFLPNKEYPIYYKCGCCGYIGTQKSYYCPKCGRDDNGFSVEENRMRFTKN